MNEIIELTKDLVSRPSITPEDKGCQDLIIERLQPFGFTAEKMRFGEVDNLWLRHGTQAPLFCFAGHTDVVPPGPLEQWQSDPFTPEIRDEKLFGRGTADMKGSIAAMCIAVERFIGQYPDYSGSIAFLITSDEEGPAVDGTLKVIETLQARDENIDWCLIGEPSSTQHVGDVIKNGRRGSLGARLVVHGKQGHVAYPQLASNPIHIAAFALAELTNTQWDQGNEFFPPTTLQISNIHAGTGVTNIIPGELEVLFNFRYSTAVTHLELKDRTEEILKRHNLDYTIEWTHSGKPFLTDSGKLVTAVSEAIHATSGMETQLSTAGGTSDGRFIAPTGSEVVELGPINASIHQANEHAGVTELETLGRYYEQILIRLLVQDCTHNRKVRV